MSVCMRFVEVLVDNGKISDQRDVFMQNIPSRLAAIALHITLPGAAVEGAARGCCTFSDKVFEI